MTLSKGKKKKTESKTTEYRNVHCTRLYSIQSWLGFDHYRVVEGLGFSTDGSAGRLVGLQAEAAAAGGSGGVRSDCDAASGFEPQRLLIALGFS